MAHLLSIVNQQVPIDEEKNSELYAHTRIFGTTVQFQRKNFLRLQNQSSFRCFENFTLNFYQAFLTHLLQPLLTQASAVPLEIQAV